MTFFQDGCDVSVIQRQVELDMGDEEESREEGELKESSQDPFFYDNYDWELHNYGTTYLERRVVPNRSVTLSAVYHVTMLGGEKFMCDKTCTSRKK